MAQPEFDPIQHEEFVSERLAKARRTAARVALFNEMVDHALDGDCTLDQALTQYLYDLDEQGIGYETS